MHIKLIEIDMRRQKKKANPPKNNTINIKIVTVLSVEVNNKVIKIKYS